MYYHHFRIEKDKFKKLPLENRLIVDMISEMIEVKFAGKVVDILKKKNNYKDPEELDSNTRCQINLMNENRDSALNAYCVLKRIYESEYDKIDSFIEDAIYESADRHSDELLEEYDWNEKVA